jgi:thioredoxin reductase (NADPH)
MAEQGLEAVAFPKLTEEQIEQLGRYGGVTPKKFRAGETLFHVGDRDFRFFVIKSGEVEILDESGDKPRSVTVHHPGGFTGDVNHLTGNPAVVTGIAKTDCEVYEVSDKALREILNQDPRPSV